MNWPRALARWRAVLAERASARAIDWARRRHGSDEGTVIIGRRRVYILPTPLGMAYAAMLFAMLLGGLNYGNNLALALTFVLAATGWVAMHACHRNLAGLRVTPAGSRAPFAGDPAEFDVLLESTSPRTDIVVRTAHHRAAAVSLVAAGRCTVSVQWPTVRRGRIRLERLRIETSFPLGLFTAWTWTHPGVEALVYPRPAARGAARPPPALEAGVAADGRARGEEDFAGLRAFRAGDPPRRIAWKALARGGELLTKEFTGAAHAPFVLDLVDVPGPTLEARLERLARWIVDAEERGDRYGLRVDGVEVPPGAGRPHCHRCLARLAVYRVPGPP